VLKKRDYYIVLGVERNAKPAAVKKAFHAKAMQYHPDKNPGDKFAEMKFRELNEAYDILKNAGKRSAYDHELRAAEMAKKGPSREEPVKTFRPPSEIERTFGRARNGDDESGSSGFLSNYEDVMDTLKMLLMFGVPFAIAGIAIYAAIQHNLHEKTACASPRTGMLTFYGESYNTTFMKEKDNSWEAPIQLSSTQSLRLGLNSNAVKVFANLTNDALSPETAYPYLEGTTSDRAISHIRTDMNMNLEWDCNNKHYSETYNYTVKN
jgi:curved DNA-binding protein CbpA